MLLAYFMCYTVTKVLYFIVMIMTIEVNATYSELGYRSYAIEGNKDFLFQPFINVYFGAAYIKWLSSFENK